MHPDRARRLPESDVSGKPNARAVKKKKKKQYQPTDEGALERSINNTKKRLRDLSRELTHKGKLPMSIRQVKERELDALREDLETALRKKARNIRITRYHHARFFERQKATRTLKKAQKAAAAEPADSPRRDELQAAVHEEEVNLNYSMYFPLLEKYVSIWAPDKKMGAGFKSTMWYLIEAAMVTNTLNDLRDRVTDEDKAEMDNASGIAKWNNLVLRAKRMTLDGDDAANDQEMGENEEEGDDD